MYGGLLTFIIVLLAVFVLFKIFGWSIKMFFRFLLNALIGAALILVFNYVLSGVFNLHQFYIETNWVTALITGVFGVPGVLGLLIYGLIV